MAEKPTGREYLRVSFDKSGRERSQDDQHAENLRSSEQLGLTLGEPYHEKGSVSASRYSRKTRDAFAQLLSDLEQDKFGAEVLILWESSRGSRRVSEWVTLIELCEERAVKIYVTSHGHMYDPANGRDRRSMLEDAVDSEYESSKTSTRVRRTLAAAAREGKPHGRTPLGYVRKYDTKSGQFLCQVEDPETAIIIRTLYADLKSGKSLISISKEFAARGWTNSNGKRYAAQQLRAMALNPAYAGIRVHRPGGKSDGPDLTQRPITPDMFQTKAQWEGLVSQDDYWCVHRRLADPRRTTWRPGGAKHLLSRIARCGACGGPLSSRVTSDYNATGEYRCAESGHITVSKQTLEEYAESAVWLYLSQPEIYSATMEDQSEQSGPELQRLRGDLEHARHELDELRAKVGSGAITVATSVVAEPMMMKRISEMESREAELTTPSQLRSLIAPGPDVRKRWDQMQMSAKREALRILFTAEHLGELHVMPCPKRGHPRSVPIAQRVAWIRDPENTGSTKSA